ncbi:hypothetical protein H5U35_06165, partial [Candidatus Aerophobetes bacterium]|nr:hypothetical protein [Candidatus Aerophobetes bacterium]
MAISLFYIPGTSDVYLYSGEKEYRRFINFYCVTEKVWGMLEKGDIERREDGWKIKTPQEVEVRFNKNDCENILPDTVTLPIFSSLLKKLKEEDINITNIYFFA